MRAAVEGCVYACNRPTSAAAVQAVVGKGVDTRALRDGNQPIGEVVGIRAHAIAEQIAVRIPGVGYRSHIRQAVGVVVGVNRRAGDGRLRQPVAHRVVRVGEYLPVTVTRARQPIEMVVAIADSDRRSRSDRRRGRNRAKFIPARVAQGAAVVVPIHRAGIAALVGRRAGIAPATRRRRVAFVYRWTGGELLALVDSLRAGTLNEVQLETVWALRAGILALAG